MCKALYAALFILFSLAILTNSQETTQKAQQQANNKHFQDNPEQDEQIKKLSSFFIELINEYDSTGSGLIKRQKYPLFLRDVFMKGSFGSTSYPYAHKNLLQQAATQFTATKDEKQDAITVQQFYDDIIHKFTLFLMEKKEYKAILDSLFESVEQKKDSKKAKAKQQSNNEKKQQAETLQL